VWILEEGDSVFGRVKDGSKSLIALAATVNLYVDSIWDCSLIRSNFGKRESCPWFDLIGYPKFGRALGPNPTRRRENYKKVKGDLVEGN
jgi:hypothetical protein